MAQSLCPPLCESWMLPAAWGPAPPPPPSPDSWGSAPAPCRSPVRRPRRPGPPGRSSRLGSGRQRQRHSASEREKQRMRTLARALHELRRFLPPSVAPAGRSLSKIETLRLATRYIGHLSALLGLGQEPPRRRPLGDPALPRGCPLCPAPAPAPARPGALAAPEPPLSHEPGPSSPLFSGDVLALLDTWMPLSPLEWPPA